MSRVDLQYHVPFVSQGSDDTACWVACLAMLMHFKEHQLQRKRTSAELCTLFRQLVASKGLNITGTIDPAQIPVMANLMGLKCFSGYAGYPELEDLIRVMGSSPVVIFGNYIKKRAATLLHATLAYRLVGSQENTSLLYIRGYDPQVAETPGASYHYDFGSFHDPSMPNFSVCKRMDYLVYV